MLEVDLGKGDTMVQEQKKERELQELLDNLKLKLYQQDIIIVRGPKVKVKQTTKKK